MQGQPDLHQLVQELKRLNQGLAAARERMKEAHVYGSAGGGAVKATVTGVGQLVSLEISPMVADPGRTEELEQFVMDAIQDARVAANTFQESQVAPLAAPLMDHIGDLSQ